MEIKAKKRILMLIAGLLLLSASGAAQSFDFVTIDVPCSDCPGAIEQAHRESILPVISSGLMWMRSACHMDSC